MHHCISVSKNLANLKKTATTTTYTKKFAFNHKIGKSKKSPLHSMYNNIKIFLVSYKYCKFTVYNHLFLGHSHNLLAVILCTKKCISCWLKTTSMSYMHHNTQLPVPQVLPGTCALASWTYSHPFQSQGATEKGHFSLRRIKTTEPRAYQYWMKK